jgi:RNA polymerase sigma-70 factor, ECF subfamily
MGRDVTGTVDDDRALVQALLGGDEAAFTSLVAQHHANMARVARSFVRNEEVARDVVQETWAAVLQGLPGFRGESSLKTWIFRILANKARRTARREARSVPFSDLRGDTGEESDAETADRFRPDGGWESSVHAWRSTDPESRSIDRQGVAILVKALDHLPDAQRAVVTMRDVEGLSSEEICEVLDITPANQRVLLHRGRSRLRRALEAAEARTAGGGS